MSPLIISASFLPGLRSPALTIDAQSYTLSIEAADELILQLQHANLQARIAAKRLAERSLLRSPDAEVDELLRSVDFQLDQPNRIASTASPASEVNHEY